MSKRKTTKKEALRILADGEYRISNDIKSGLNANDVIIGTPGSGKTRGYVIPNILQYSGSMIIADTKGNLYHKTARTLEEHGYRVECLDFVSPRNSTVGYNPLKFVRRNENGSPNEQDIQTIAAVLTPVNGHEHDPYWQYAARTLAVSLISYVLEVNSPEEQTMAQVKELHNSMCPGTDNSVSKLMRLRKKEDPNSFAVAQYASVIPLDARAGRAEKTESSIVMVLGPQMQLFGTDIVKDMNLNENQVDFAAMGREKTALFVNVSDSDRAMDSLVNMFYAQALQQLIYSADHDYKNSRLPVPVRLFLDDFATNVVIEDFDKIIAVVRSRNIHLSIILQSISQLNSIYGLEAAKTILNCCDNMLYLGGTEECTVNMIAQRLNRPFEQVLNMPLDRAYLFTRGEQAKSVRKYELSEHPNYDEVELEGM